MAERTSWQALRQQRMTEPGVDEAYQATRRAYRLGCAVRALREQEGLRQSQLARSIGLAQSEVSRVEAGGAKLTLSVLERLAGVLGAELVVRLERTDLDPQVGEHGRSSRRGPELAVPERHGPGRKSAGRECQLAARV
jgi:transcriptional regulator with XRE-family HTH domain